MINFKLTIDEIRMLDMFREYGTAWIEMSDMSEHGRDCVDMLVLSGLVERNRTARADGGTVWLDQWRLTEAGSAILDDQEMAHYAVATPDNQEGMFS